MFHFAAFTDKGKFLLAARRYRHGANTEYIISLDADDLSQGSNAYVGKLRLGLLLPMENEGSFISSIVFLNIFLWCSVNHGLLLMQYL